MGVSKDSADGISVFYKSDEKCSGDEVFALNFDVICDSSEEEDDTVFVPAKIKDSDLTSCQKYIKFKHSSGCSAYSVLGFTQFMSENVWLSGTILVVLGGLIGIMGEKWFAHLTGNFAGLCAFCTFMIFASIFQWLNTTVGLIICGIIAICCYALAYWVMVRWNNVAVLFLCIGGGFLLGGIVEGLVIAISSWESFTFYLIITISCMLIGGYLGCKKETSVKQYLTAVVGSYIFMRGFTFYFGGFPSEMEMYNYMSSRTQQNSTSTASSGYVALFVGSTFLCIWVQKSCDWAKSGKATSEEYNRAK